MVEEIVSKSYRCTICKSHYTGPDGKKHAEECEAECKNLKSEIESAIKVGAYYGFEEGGEMKIVYVVKMCDNKVYGDAMSIGKYGIHMCEFCKGITAYRVKTFLEAERITKEQVPEKLNGLFQSYKNKIISTCFSGEVFE